uniref:Regulatory protein TetR n=1 Tax=Rhodopseudomonas palustris (strain DX-1) TaxID=652103 RepID=E6VDK3_RHOPX
MAAREQLLTAGLAEFDRLGIDGATVAAIRDRAGVSNGSFFHLFKTKHELAGALFLDVLQRYHAAVLVGLEGSASAAEGIADLIRAHLDWVVLQRIEARYLFEISRGEWSREVREAQGRLNTRLGERLDAWRAPLLTSGALMPMPANLFMSQMIGPAQILCRGWLSGRDAGDPRDHTEVLIACAVRALVTGNADRAE